MLKNCAKVEILRIKEWLFFPMMNQKKKTQIIEE